MKEEILPTHSIINLLKTNEYRGVKIISETENDSGETRFLTSFNGKTYKLCGGKIRILYKVLSEGGFICPKCGREKGIKDLAMGGGNSLRCRTCFSQGISSIQVGKYRTDPGYREYLKRYGAEHYDPKYSREWYQKRKNTIINMGGDFQVNLIKASPQKRAVAYAWRLLQHKKYEIRSSK